MERRGAQVLLDPTWRMPYAAPADAGLAWLRSHVVRFSDGRDALRRRALAEAVLERAAATVGVLPRGTAVVPALLASLGLPAGLADDVALVAAAYQPHAPQSDAADAACDRLLRACGGRTEAAAAVVCVLVQASAATVALEVVLERGGDPWREPPVPTTRRRDPDGAEVEVSLVGAPFGLGPHRCPAESLVRTEQP